MQPPSSPTVCLFQLSLPYFEPERGVPSKADVPKGHPRTGQLLFESFDSIYFLLAGIITYRMEKHTKEHFITPWKVTSSV